MNVHFWLLRRLLLREKKQHLLSLFSVHHTSKYVLESKLCMPGISICIVVRALKFRYDPTDMTWDTRAPSLRNTGCQDQLTHVRSQQIQQVITDRYAFQCAEPRFAPPRLHCWHRLEPGPRNRWALPIATAPKLSAVTHKGTTRCTRSGLTMVSDRCGRSLLGRLTNCVSVP